MSQGSNQDFCRGCGSPIQTVNPREPGFVPEQVHQKSGNGMICQRCYRLTNYGEKGAVQPKLHQIQQAVAKGIDQSQLLVLVADFSDLTGTLPIWSGFLGDKPYLLAVNKSDLVPERTEAGEIRAYLENYLIRHSLAKPRAVLLVNTVTRTGGITALADQICVNAPPRSKIALLGATNVGKSSLINRFLMKEHSKIGPTVSKYPGTTMGLSNWSILEGRNTLVDTPGLVPGDRLGDVLCPDCASALVAGGKMGQKLWGLKPGQGLILGGLFGIEPLAAAEESVLISFGSPLLKQHRTAVAKIGPYLEEGPDWLVHYCKECRAKLNWQVGEAALEPNQDLAVAGLGWVSLRGRAGRFRIRLPRGVRWEIRPALVGKK